MTPLPLAFYGEQPTVACARALLGKTLVRRFADGTVATGRIVETEAYTADDPACHAFRGETARNRTMFGSPGRAYIHLNYGLHYCLNAVTAPAGVAEAVLVRAIEPAAGRETMWRRYYGGGPNGGNTAATGPEPAERDLARLTAGPGKLSRALGIDRSFDGVDLTDGAGPIFLAWGDEVADGDVVTTTRIGITKGADLPWRFYVRASPSVSRR